MNRVLQPRPLVVLGLNVWMGTAAGADELAARQEGISNVVRQASHWLVNTTQQGFSKLWNWFHKAQLNNKRMIHDTGSTQQGWSVFPALSMWKLRLEERNEPYMR